MASYADAAGKTQVGDISFGFTLESAPFSYYIKAGDTAPPECPGSAQNPQAAPGHLCVYEAFADNVQPSRFACALSVCPGATPYGAGLVATSIEDEPYVIRGQWAVTAP